MGDICNVKKVCGFYVSTIHLVTMILPYIKNQIRKGTKIETIIEYNLKENVSNVLSNLVIDNQEKKKILNINWESNKPQKYSNFEKQLSRTLAKTKRITILISGGKKYIEDVNKMIGKFINKYINKIKSKKITIINCYGVTEFDDNIREILDIHEFIINTSGIHRIEDVFQGYKNEEAN